MLPMEREGPNAKQDNFGSFVHYLMIWAGKLIPRTAKIDWRY